MKSGLNKLSFPNVIHLLVEFRCLDSNLSLNVELGQRPRWCKAGTECSKQVQAGWWRVAQTGGVWGHPSMTCQVTSPPPRPLPVSICPCSYLKLMIRLLYSHLFPIQGLNSTLHEHIFNGQSWSCTEKGLVCRVFFWISYKLLRGYLMIRMISCLSNSTHYILNECYRYNFYMHLNNFKISPKRVNLFFFLQKLIRL